MRVLVVTNDYPPRIGGIQNYVERLVAGLVAAGDDVLVYASSYHGAAEWDAEQPYRVVRAATPTMLPTPLVTARVLRLIREHDAEVVVFGAAFPLGLMGPVLRARTGVPYVAFTHGLEVSSVRLPGGAAPLRVVGSRAAAVTYVSHWCQDLLQPAFGGPGRHELLPPAVNPEQFHRDVDGNVVRERYGLSGVPLVVCVARLVERKGQDQLIAAFDAVRRRVPDAHLLVVGDGPHRGALETQAERLGHADRVVFTGSVGEAELAAHYAAGDVFAMPCRERKGGLEVEAFGIVFIQAQAVGRPVVAGNIGGVPDALRHGDTGFLVDGTDTAAVADAVATLLEDPERATAMGNIGADWVADQFTWSARTAQLRELLATSVRASSGTR
ncbi:MAG: glycosyltransferase family 4 protein [Actinomycetes bacterium]